MKISGSPLHGRLNAAQQLAGPLDVAGHWGGVSGQGGRSLVLLVLPLHRLEVPGIALEHQLVLGC